MQLGDGATTRLDTRYVVERTEIPTGAVLADSAELAGRYVDIVAAEQENPEALAGFLVDVVGAVDNATDDNVLGYADGLPGQKATVLGLFSLTAVHGATSVMVGEGNRLHTELKLDTAPILADRDIARAVRQHRANRPSGPADTDDEGTRR